MAVQWYGESALRILCLLTLSKPESIWPNLKGFRYGFPSHALPRGGQKKEVNKLRGV